MRVEFSASRGNSNLSAGELAKPGIYVVDHRDPAHLTPHEILIAEPMLLPQCKSCAGVRFSFKSALPERIEDSGEFQTDVEIKSIIESTHRLISESQRILSRLNGH